MDIKQEFRTLLHDAVDETGIVLGKSVDEVAEYASTRAEHLSTIVGQQGFELAARAERDNVALFAGVEVAGDLDEIDGQLIGLIKGMLTLAAKILAA